MRIKSVITNLQRGTKWYSVRGSPYITMANTVFIVEPAIAFYKHNKDLSFLKNKVVATARP